MKCIRSSLLFSFIVATTCAIKSWPRTFYSNLYKNLRKVGVPNFGTSFFVARKKGGIVMPDNGEIPGIVKVLFSVLIAVAFGGGLYAIVTGLIEPGGFVESNFLDILEKIFGNIMGEI